MEIKKFYTLFRRWLWLMLTGLILAAVGGYLISARQTPIYQASTRFVVMRAAQTNADYYSYLDSQQLISTYTELLTTERLTQKASELLGFDVQVGQATATQVGDTQFVRLTVNDTDPIQATAIANALVDLLIAENEDLQAVRYITAEENLQNRINSVQAQITILQDQINDISDLTVKEQLAQVESQIQELQTQAIDLEASTANYDEYTASETQKQQYADDKNTLTQIRPILALYQEIYTNLVVMGEPINNGENTTSQLNQLQTTLTLYQQIYISSISSLENIRLMRAQNMPNVVQIEPAVVPTSSVSPRPLRTAALAGAVGLIVTASIGFLIEYLDDTVKTPDDVKAILDLPVLGFVAEIDSKSHKNHKVSRPAIVANQPRSPISEAFRSLRTNLEFSSLDNPLKSILVTSAGASEGKTTIATNLAEIEVQGGKKVLLVDCDLRRPNLHKMFSLPNRIGLSDMLRGNVEVKDIVQVIGGKDVLHVITSGSLPPNPAEFLGSQRFSEVLSQLEKQYDLVILDTPPMVVADVQILSSKVDGILFVIQPGVTHGGVAKTIIEDLRRIDAHILGIVLNRIPRNRDLYYGGYRYYSPYTGKNKYTNMGTEVIQKKTKPEKDIINEVFIGK